MGPWITPAEDVPDPQNLSLKTVTKGEVIDRLFRERPAMSSRPAPVSVLAGRAASSFSRATRSC